MDLLTKTLKTYLLLAISIIAAAITCIPHHHHGNAICMSPDIATESSHAREHCTQLCPSSLTLYRKDKAATTHHITAPAIRMTDATIQAPTPAAMALRLDTRDDAAEPLHSSTLHDTAGLRSPPVLA